MLAHYQAMTSQYAKTVLLDLHATLSLAVSLVPAEQRVQEELCPSAHHALLGLSARLLMELLFRVQMGSLPRVERHHARYSVEVQPLFTFVCSRHVLRDTSVRPVASMHLLSVQLGHSHLV